MLCSQSAFGGLPRKDFCRELRFTVQAACFRATADGAYECVDALGSTQYTTYTQKPITYFAGGQGSVIRISVETHWASLRLCRWSLIMCTSDQPLKSTAAYVLCAGKMRKLNRIHRHARLPLHQGIVTTAPNGRF